MSAENHVAQDDRIVRGILLLQKYKGRGNPVSVSRGVIFYQADVKAVHTDELTSLTDLGWEWDENVQAFSFIT
jgi:hypothetical protein